MNKYINHSGYIDVHRLALTKRRMMARVEVPKDELAALSRQFAWYLIGCVVVTGTILYFFT